MLQSNVVLQYERSETVDTGLSIPAPVSFFCYRAEPAQMLRPFIITWILP